MSDSIRFVDLPKPTQRIIVFLYDCENRYGPGGATYDLIAKALAMGRGWVKEIAADGIRRGIFVSTAAKRRGRGQKGSIALTETGRACVVYSTSSGARQ